MTQEFSDKTNNDNVSNMSSEKETFKIIENNNEKTLKENSLKITTDIDSVSDKSKNSDIDIPIEKGKELYNVRNSDSVSFISESFEDDSRDKDFEIDEDLAESSESSVVPNSCSSSIIHPIHRIKIPQNLIGQNNHEQQSDTDDCVGENMKPPLSHQIQVSFIKVSSRCLTLICAFSTFSQWWTSYFSF